MKTTKKIIGILLAAGNSRRFGTNKLLHQIKNQSLLSITAKKLKSSLPDSVAIIKPDDQHLKTLLINEGLRVVECNHSINGIGASLACGIKSSMDADAWIIMLADMPFIQTTTINSVVNVMKAGALIAVPEYAGHRGHPVGFCQDFLDDLAALENDVGALQILQNNEKHITSVHVHDPGIRTDVDTPQDINNNKYSRL